MLELCQQLFRRATNEPQNIPLIGQLTLTLNEYFNAILEKKHVFKRSMLHKCQEVFNERD